MEIIFNMRFGNFFFLSLRTNLKTLEENIKNFINSILIPIPVSLHALKPLSPETINKPNSSVYIFLKLQYKKYK